MKYTCQMNLDANEFTSTSKIEMLTLNEWQAIHQQIPNLLLNACEINLDIPKCYTSNAR